MATDVEQLVLAGVDPQRRDILRRILLGSAFVAPAVASFPMDALAAPQNPIRTGNTSTIDLHGRIPGTAPPANPSSPPRQGR